MNCPHCHRGMRYRVGFWICTHCGLWKRVEPEAKR